MLLSQGCQNQGLYDNKWLCLAKDTKNSEQSGLLDKNCSNFHWCRGGWLPYTCILSGHNAICKFKTQ